MVSMILICLVQLDRKLICMIPYFRKGYVFMSFQTETSAEKGQKIWNRNFT